MTVKLFQSLINQIREFMDGFFGVMDETGLILGCTDDTMDGSVHPAIASILNERSLFYESQGFLFQKVYIKNRMEFIVFINLEGEHSRKLLSMLAINVSNIRNYYEEKFDRGNFFKSIITDNILPGDIQLKAKELHIPSSVYRSVFLIKTEKVRDVQPHEVIQSLFPKKIKDFVIALDDESTVLIKELRDDEDTREIDKTAKSIIDTLNTELMVKAQIGIGSIVDSVREIGRSYREAQTALQIGSIFENDKAIINYNNLGIGRLIYQLPTTMCKLFLKEVFKEGSFEALDSETLLTIQKFFENNLNVSETSRQLYVHRNTLVYRLDKIQKITGLDLRNFDDAIIFKVSMLVKKYLDKTEGSRGEYV
ncbi:MAG TPA: helix-turn-helix domain-containing protein [Clostridia bacterium]|nr:helix-turn-helix domain-containing protein [Clostridia bacterium]